MADLSIKEYYSFHKSVFEVWRFGKPVESWKESNNILCIRYASGAWSHYRRSGGYIEFWQF